MRVGDVASRGRAALLQILDDTIAEAHESEGPVSAIIVHTHSGRSVHIRVSTRTAGTWQSTKSLRDGKAVRDPGRLWAFVMVGKRTDSIEPVAFLAYEADVRRDIDDDVQKWFEHGGHGDPSVKDHGHTAITEKRVRSLARPFDELLA